MAAHITCPPGYAIKTFVGEGAGCVFIPAKTEMEDQTCGLSGHRHSMDLDDKGRFVVNKEKHEPDIVFDGLCHDNNDEHVIQDPNR